jgi:hypothetical protein
VDGIVRNECEKAEMKPHSLTRQSRRSLLAMGTAAGLAGLLEKPTASAVPINTQQLATCQANVKNFGAHVEMAPTTRRLHFNGL